MLIQSEEEGICVAVVTFNPAKDFLLLLEKIAPLSVPVLVVDNSTDHLIKEQVRTISRNLAVELINNELNHGVAAAINQALLWAGRRQARWLLMLDQDVVVRQPGELLPPFLDILSEPSRSPDLAVIAGIALNGPVGATGAYSETDSAITSGSLYNVEQVVNCGGAWEELFVDGIDIEMCLSIRSSGKKIVAFEHPGIGHKVGSGRRVEVFGRSLFVTDHPPVRRYYSARNRLLIARKHERQRDWYHCIREDLIAPLFEKKTFSKWRATVLGLIHGFRGLSGPAPIGLFESD